MKFYVYILYNLKHDKFYIGQTNCLDARIIEHNSGQVNYTLKYDGGWNLVYYVKYSNRTEAIKREKFLKKQKNRNFYKRLCKL
jgi:putative endonuclease